MATTAWPFPSISPLFIMPDSERHRLTTPPVTDQPVTDGLEGGVPEVSDAIVALAIAGDEAAQRAVYERHAPRIFRLAFRMTGDGSLAEDLTQDVFVRALDRLHQFRGDSRLGTWLYQIGVSVILNALRKRKSQQSRERPLEEELKADSAPLHVDPVLRERVRDAVRRLPAELRVVVLMYDVEGYAHNEIANVLAISQGASRTRLMRARERLRELLATEEAEWTA